MTTNTTYDNNTVPVARQALRPTRGQGWLGGFGNMLDKELGEWFKTKRWIWQAAIWLVMINGFIAFVLFLAPKLDPNALQSESGAPPIEVMGLTLFFSFAIQAGAIGAIILAQDEVIREKQSGTAAWILSKPAARQSFILTKLLSNVIGILIFIVALPALVALGEIYLATRQVTPLVPFLGGLGIVILALFFYLTLTIMLGVLFEQRPPVLGISFGVMFGGLIAASFIPQINYVLPVSIQNIALAVAQGQPIPVVAVSQLISTAILSVIFILVALWQFNRLEF
jgi:ABC-2 type transport system permease protein